MCVHELTTNSLKYGALARPEGGIDVSWTVDGTGEIALIWRERGGPTVTPPASGGFGTRLMDRLVRHELNGRFERDYDPAGLIVRGWIRLPEGSRFRSDL